MNVRPFLTVSNGPHMEYPYHDESRPDILRMIPADGNEIGSIGCGSGATEAVLIAQGRRVHGVDVAPEAVERAKGRLTSMRRIAPSDRRPFEEASLDGLILADVIEHIPAAWDALADFAKAVRPGGWVAISVPNMRGWDVLRTFILGGDWPEKPTGIFDATHVQFMSRKRLERWCRDAGLVPQIWFAMYDPNGPRRRRWFTTLDRVTFGLFHGWLMYELQVVCRRPPAAPPVAPPGETP